MLQELSLYSNATRALAELVRVDEVKPLADKARAMALYAAQVKDRQLLDRAVEVRERAEIRMGELLREMGETGQRAKAGDNQHHRGNGAAPPPTLASLGVNPTQSSRWQKKAALPKEKQEALIARAKDRAAKLFEPTVSKAPQTRPPRETIEMVDRDGNAVVETLKPDDYAVYDIETDEVIGYGMKTEDGAIDVYIESATNGEWQPPKLRFSLVPPLKDDVF